MPTATMQSARSTAIVRISRLRFLKTAFPWHVEEFRLVDGSGGPGKFRGGMSLTKTVGCTNTDMTFSYMADRQRIAPWGIHGGLPGGKAELLFKRNGSDEWLTISQAFN